MKNRKPHRFNRKIQLFFLSGFFFLLAVSQPLLAKISKLGPAGHVVNTFCMVDSLFAPWKYTQELTVWKDAPGWDGATIIDGFEILKETYKKDKAQVDVQYRVVAEQNGEKTKKVNRTEVVTFELIKLDGAWKITSPQDAPHLLEETASKLADCKSLNSLYLFNCSQ